ncbi:hypothetical protein KR018_004923 [Drosophila ironensis]|nr:hypothetical protein KR018_004923 [Drosophila ironensis]
MEEEDECIHGVLDLVNGVARQLLAKELFPYLPTAAQVAQKRIQLYELLLEGGPTDSERMLQLFARARQELEAEAEDGEGERENVENLLVLLEPPMASEPPEEVPVDIEDIENREPMPTFRLLKPRPFGLEDSDAECDRFSLLENRKPKILRSLDQMQVEMEERPLELEPPCKFLPPKLVIEPKGSPSDRYKPKISRIGGLAEAMRRVWKDKEEPTGEPPRVPDFRREEEPPAEEEPEYVVESKLSRVFITDLMTTMDIRGLVDPGMQLFFIEEAVCVEHLKRAAAGIASESIMPCPEDPDSLTVIPNLNIRDVAPARVETFAQNFLLSGRAFRRLNARVNFERDAMSPVQRPVHRTLRDAIVDILSNCREFMLNINCKKVIELEHCCSQSTLVIQHLNQMFENEPRLHFEGDVTGSFILSCIRLAIDNCNNITYLQLLLYLLHCICRTYFYQLKRWLYLGEVDEKFNEIFIARSEIGSPTLMDECSREFFERGFQVKKELVPWFLRGCEDEIMKCGKYNQLLRAYNPQHPIFEVEFPEMLICFDEKMQRAERRKLMKQFSALYEHFGACSMQSIMEERMNAKRKFKNIMLERTRAHIAEWEERQKVLQEEADFRKKLYYEDLNAQQELQAQARLEKRRQEVIDELNFEKERNRLEDMRLEREKLQLQETVDQLQEELDAREEFKEESSPDQSDRSFVSCQDGLEFQLDLGLENIEERTEKEEEEEENASELEASSSTLVPYQRSVSDVLNSNEVNQTELDRNRQAMHSSEQFHECQTWVQLKSSGSGITVTNMPSDINANLSEELTDLERNRLRMNQHDPFNNFNSTVDEHVKRMQCQVASTTERAQNRRRRARNKRRVMECEYNIIFGEKTKKPCEKSMSLPLQPHMLQVEVTLPTPTPMSTTSDGAIGGLTPKNYTDDIDSDPANNNNHSDENYDTTTSHIPQKASTSKRPIFRGGLPTNPVLTCSPNENNEYYETMETPVEIPDVNPYIVHRCLKMCVMNPVNAYYSLLRNEVLKIFQECRIYDHFRKLRDYFFLLDGQFGTRLTGEILGKIESGMDPRSLCQKGVLDSILNNALANNTTDETTVCQNLTLNCKTIPETLNIMSLEATSMLMLHCKMDWPLNLVISPETIVRYGNIFGYLLKVRHVSHVLEETYLYLNQLPKLLSPELRAALHYRHLQMIRHKLAHFLTSLQTHLVAKALQSSWQKFKEQLVGANSIEGLYQQHVIYLKQVAFIAHLNRGGAKVRETIEKIFLIVLRFCKVLQSQSFVMDDENRFVHPRFKRLIQEEAEFNKFMQYLIYLSDKAYASGYQEEIGDLISVINFNKYYKVAEEESVS